MKVFAQKFDLMPYRRVLQQQIAARELLEMALRCCCVFIFSALVFLALFEWVEI